MTAGKKLMQTESGVSQLTWGGHTGPALDTRDGYDVIDCARCGFAHVVPLPTESEAKELYAENYYADEKPDYLARAAEDEAWAKLSYVDRLETVEALLMPDRRRLLDIGSGPGYFLKTARERGWDAQGIDPSTQAVAHAREMGIPMTEGLFDDMSAKRLGCFDVITLTNMLEHVPQPRTLIANAAACLTPGGIICVTVPNDYNPLQETIRAAEHVAPWWVAPPHHLNYFGFNSLSRLLSRYGLHEISRLTSFPMEMFALMGDLYMGNDALGRACHLKRRRFDESFAKAGTGKARRLFYSALAQAGFGREVILFARKGDA